MSDKPRTSEAYGVRMGTSTWLSKWLPHRKPSKTGGEQEDDSPQTRQKEFTMTERPQTPAEKGQRSHKGPALLTKLLIRRNRYEDDEDGT